MISKYIRKIKPEVAGILIVFLTSVVVCVISVRINIFRYNNFDFGKFDLGNMTQMVWNTLQGRPLYLTDYFGGNVPRWSMSHVDPILLLFVPVFALFPHPLTLVFAQLFLTTILAPLVLFKIARLNLKSNLVSTLIALAYLFYPALGYLNTQTGFHGVSAAMPFFLLSFFFVEKMHHTQKFTKINFIGLWLSAILTMSGKEQLALYIALLCVFGLLFRAPFPNFKHPMSKNLLALLGVSAVWFVVAFFVIIPKYAHYRTESYTAFTQEVGVDTSLSNDVVKSNYFFSRYEEFGDSYTGIILGMLSDPKRLVNIVFAGDKLDNFSKTFVPTLFLPFLAPQILVIAVPDLLINYGTTAGGIGTAEISNHRISMIIPVVFLAIIFAINTLSRYLSIMYGWAVRGFAELSKSSRSRKNGQDSSRAIKGREREAKSSPPTPKNVSKYIMYVMGLAVLVSNIYTTFKYNNPVFLWLSQAVSKRITPIAYAKFDREVGLKKDLKLGDRFKISGLENKDRECAQMIMDIIPQEASVSGPDYLGAHMAQRETYAIFPALYSKADFVIVDVFSQKIMRILDSDVSLVRDVVGDMIKNPSYTNVLGCGNLFVFKKSEAQSKSPRLPMQEKYEYPKDLKLEIFEGLFLADFEIPSSVTRGVTSQVKFVYYEDSTKLADYVLFTTFINSDTGEIYQSANIPSYGLFNMRDWVDDMFYIENVDLTLPTAVDPGKYHAFVGITNNIRTRSIYLADVEVK